MSLAIARPVDSYDGTSLVTLVGTERRLTFWLASGLDDGLAVRGVDTVIPGSAGEVERVRIAGARIIEIQGWVRGLGADDAARADDFRDAMETLRTLFSPTRTAATLIVGLEDAVRTATIAARPLPDPIIAYKPVPAASVSVQLKAVDPVWVIA